MKSPFPHAWSKNPGVSGSLAKACTQAVISGFKNEWINEWKKQSMSWNPAWSRVAGIRVTHCRQIYFRRLKYPLEKKNCSLNHSFSFGDCNTVPLCFPSPPPSPPVSSSLLSFKVKSSFFIYCYYMQIYVYSKDTNKTCSVCIILLVCVRKHFKKKIKLKTNKQTKPPLWIHV